MPKGKNQKKICDHAEPRNLSATPRLHLDASQIFPAAQDPMFQYL
jgi:hypothetical protein